MLHFVHNITLIGLSFLQSVSFVTRTSWSLEKLFCRKGGMLGGDYYTLKSIILTLLESGSDLFCLNKFLI
jgi:hypothetical protein